MAFQFRRGTDAERQSITPRPGEPLYVTDTGQVYVGDGTTQGGNLVSLSVSDDESPSLGGSLNLNGNDITGTGDIDITGSIHATGTITADGNITLGDGAEDNVIVGGVISSSLIPSQDGRYDLGDNLSSWRNGFFEGVEVDGELKANSLQIKSIELDDSTTVYDAETQSLFVESAFANVFEGNFIGDVFSQDSSIIIDSIKQKISIPQIDNGADDLLIGSLADDSDSAIEMYSPHNVKFHTIRKDDGLSGFLNTRKSNGTLADPLPVETGQMLGGVVVQGWSSDWGSAGGLRVSVDDSATFSSSLTMKGITELVAFDNDQENPNSSLKLTSQGNASVNIFSANQYLQTGFYNDVTERDDLISNPQEGSIIFVQDDGNGDPKFQGYTGTTWVNLN